MAYYQFYSLDPLSGYIQQVQRFDAADDEAAKAIAMALEPVQPVELWCGHRMLWRFDPEPSLVARAC